MQSQLELLIVILNYKTAKMTIECVETVLPQLQHNHAIIIVDNQSPDDSWETLQNWHAGLQNEQVRLTLAPSNGGFSAGNNIGIRSEPADFYLLLNSDTLLRDNALRQLLNCAKLNPTYGLISPKLTWPDSEPQISCFHFHNPISEFIASSGTGAITRLLSRFDVPIPLTTEISFPEWTSFACVLVRKEVFDHIGLMDEGYFLYYEDADFCKLASKAGWRVCNDPSAEVVHLRGGSSSVKKRSEAQDRLPKYYYESRTRFFKKHYGTLGYYVANICWSLGHAISLLRRLLGKKGMPTVKNASKDIWTNAFKTRVSQRSIHEI